MAHTTGTAANHNDLIDKLRLWLVSIGWAELHYSAPSGANNYSRLSMRANGSGAGDEFFMHIESEQDVTIGAYSWKMRASAGYNSGVPVGGQLSVSPSTYLSLWNNEIKYYFYANDRHVKIVAKIGTAYVSAYLGLFLPYAAPTEYRKPFYVAGNTGVLQAAALNSAGSRMIADPALGSSYVLNKNGEWLRVINHINTGTANAPSYNDRYETYVWPYAAGSSNTSSATDWPTFGIESLRPNLAGEMPLIQCQLFTNYIASSQLLGALEGVYATGGFGRISEQSAVAGGKSFRLFQNVIRSGLRDFMAIEEVN